MANLPLDPITASKIANKFKLEYELDRKTGRKFNMFELAEIGKDEVKICLVLYKLLDPRGSHCQGTFFLEKFCRTVLNLDKNELTEEELTSAKVKKEYSIYTQRRIDIVIITKNCFIPIEVKIESADQGKQCFDYYEESRRQMGEDAVVFYLTPNGRPPAKKSSVTLSVTDKSGKGHIRCISFKDDVSAFLQECISDVKIKSVPTVHEVLVQLFDTVKALSKCGYSYELMNRIRDDIPNEKTSEELKRAWIKYFIEETLNRFKQKENLTKNNQRIIQKSHYWKYYLSYDIGKTSRGESISISIQVDVYDNNVYWGMALWAEGAVDKKSEYHDKLLTDDDKVKDIIDKKIRKSYQRQNTWIFKEQRLGIMDTEKLDFYKLLIPDEMEILIEEVVCDVDEIFKDYRNIDE